jgi:hypothetical protein
MNVNTGELISGEALKELYGEPMNRADLRAAGFTDVPKKLQGEAEQELGGQDRVIVDMEKDTPLVNWAKSQQKQAHAGANSKKRRRMAKESRKQNRGK